MRRALAATLVLAMLLPLVACRFHMARIDLNRPLRVSSYDAIVVGESTRRDVLALLGAPDAVHYNLEDLVFEYWAGSHRGTDLRFFLPSDVFPLPIDPLSVLGAPRFFFDPFSEPEEFRPTVMERAATSAANAAVSLVPFTSGEELVTLHGRQVRLDELRVTFDRNTKKATSKALRLATGEYQRETLPERLLLRVE
jgi:hypothetical protein